MPLNVSADPLSWGFPSLQKIQATVSPWFINNSSVRYISALKSV